jgi:hypothetical protein
MCCSQECTGAGAWGRSSFGGAGTRRSWGARCGTRGRLPRAVQPPSAPAGAHQRRNNDDNKTAGLHSSRHAPPKGGCNACHGTRLARCRGGGGAPGHPTKLPSWVMPCWPYACCCCSPAWRTAAARLQLALWCFQCCLAHSGPQYLQAGRRQGARGWAVLAWAAGCTLALAAPAAMRPSIRHMRPNIRHMRAQATGAAASPSLAWQSCSPCSA